MTDGLCLYLGCWGRPGHQLWSPGGRPCGLPAREAYDLSNLEGMLAPRVTRSGRIVHGETRNDSRDWDRHGAVECPQGQFLRHRHGRWTLLQWWDRSQGDGRGACNSSVLLEGDRASGECLAALRESFPEVVANLARAGVELVEVSL